jgi:DNA primase
VTLAPDGLLRVHCFGCDFSGDAFTLIAQARGLHVKHDFPRVLRDGAELASLWAVVQDLDARSEAAAARSASLMSARRPSARSGERITERTPTGAGGRIDPRTRAAAEHPVGERTERRTPAAVQRPTAGERTAGRTPPARSERSDVQTLDLDTFDRIASALLEACPLDAQPDVCAYLQDRKLLDLAREAGWAALPLDARPLVTRLAEAFGAETLERSGLVAHRSDGVSLAWDGNRLVIPWRELGADGAVQTIQRRLVRAPRSSREQKYVVPRARRPEQPYAVAGDLEDLGEHTALALVEGAVDALALRWLARREGLDLLVLALAGVNDWRPSWAALATGRIVYLALDADRAGEHAIATIHRDLFRAHAVKRWRPKTGKDWAEHLSLVRTP